MVHQKNENRGANLSNQSKSTISRERDCESESIGKRNGLCLDYKANSKCHEADDMQKMGSDDTARTTQVKKDTDSRTTKLSRLNYGECDLNCWRSNSQHVTESSCSNSLQSNHSRQETGKEANSFWNSGLTVDSSNSESVERHSEEPALASSESDVYAQTAVKISSLVGSHSSLQKNVENGDNSQEWRVVMLNPENVTGEVLEKTDIIDKSIVCSEDDSNSLNLRSKVTVDKISQNEPDNLSSLIIDSQSARGCDNILAVEGKILEVGTVSMDCDLTGNESSGPSMKRPDKISVKDQDEYIAGFDLNEDLNTTAMDDYVGPNETISSPEVIRVVAKAGIPRGSPMSPLKFEGPMGWMGSAKTSAFRRVFPSQTMDQRACSSTISSPKNMKLLSGIDLNVAAVEDDVTNCTAAELHYMPSSSTLQDSAVNDTRRTKRLKIDLNRSLCDTEDDPVQPSVPPSVDLNVNAASTDDKLNNVQCESQVRRFYENHMDPFKQELNYSSNNYWVDLRTLQQQLVGTDAPGQQYLVTPAPYVLQPMQQRGSHLQQVLPFAINALTPQNYLPTAPFHLASSSARPSAGTVPYVRYSQEHPQILYPGNVQHSFIMPTRTFDVVHDHSTGYLTPSLKVDVKGDGSLAANGSKKMEAGQSLFVSDKYYSTSDREAWYGTAKRKEPEGGLDYQQLGHRESR